MSWAWTAKDNIIQVKVCVSVPTLLWTNYYCGGREQKTQQPAVAFDIYHCLIIKRVVLPQEFNVDEKFGLLIKVSASGLRHA